MTPIAQAEGTAMRQVATGLNRTWLADIGIVLLPRRDCLGRNRDQGHWPRIIPTTGPTFRGPPGRPVGQRRRSVTL